MILFNFFMLFMVNINCMPTRNAVNKTMKNMKIMKNNMSYPIDHLRFKMKIISLILSRK